MSYPVRFGLQLNKSKFKNLKNSNSLRNLGASFKIDAAAVLPFSILPFLFGFEFLNLKEHILFIPVTSCCLFTYFIIIPEMY